MGMGKGRCRGRIMSWTFSLFDLRGMLAGGVGVYGWDFKLDMWMALCLLGMIFSEGLIGLNGSLGSGQFSSINSGTLTVMTTTSLMIHKSTEKSLQTCCFFDSQACSDIE
jgi:hypothetical protein